MSWRETLGVILSKETTYTHNSHNTQKPAGIGNCADIADSAYRDSKGDNSRLLEVLADACRDLDIAPAEVVEALSPKDIENWRKGAIPDDTLAAFARLLAQRREMDQGIRPALYNKHATCQRCGPIWLWISGRVLGCPWCWNRTLGKPIPRPCSVKCGGCVNFKRIDHPHLGHCTKGQPEDVAGLWDGDHRYCEQYLPRSRASSNFSINSTRVDKS